MSKYTYHCSICGNQVDEQCFDHPEATVESIVSSYGISASQSVVQSRLNELATDPCASPFPLDFEGNEEQTVVADFGIAPLRDSDICELCIAGDIEGAE